MTLGDFFNRIEKKESIKEEQISNLTPTEEKDKFDFNDTKVDEHESKIKEKSKQTLPDDDDNFFSKYKFDEEDDTEFNYKKDTTELSILQDNLNQLKTKLDREQNFKRTENKFDFASEVINSKENQKTSNLNETEIDDLIRKRRFTNLCNSFKWFKLGEIMGKIVTDVESYSLSKEALLVKLITTDLSRNASVTENRVRKLKGGRTRKEALEDEIF